MTLWIKQHYLQIGLATFTLGILALPGYSTPQCGAPAAPTTGGTGTSGQRRIFCPNHEEEENRQYGALIKVRGNVETVLYAGEFYDPFDGTVVDDLNYQADPADQYFMRVICNEDMSDSDSVLVPITLLGVPATVTVKTKQKIPQYNQIKVPKPRYDNPSQQPTTKPVSIQIGDNYSGLSNLFSVINQVDPSGSYSSFRCLSVFPHIRKVADVAPAGKASLLRRRCAALTAGTAPAG